MLILKNVTAVQLHPAKVQEGVDIAIENDVIVAIGDALTQRYPDASYKDAWSDCDAGNCLLAQPFLLGAFRGIGKHRPCPDFISTLKNLWWRLDRALDEEVALLQRAGCSTRSD